MTRAAVPSSALVLNVDVVAWRGRAILIADSVSVGTPTLAAELIRHGAAPYSHTRAVIDEAGMVYPDERLPDSPGALEPALLVVTACVPDATWAPVVLEGARAVLPVLERLPAMNDAPALAMRVASRLESRLVTLQGPRPHASDVAPAILEYVDRVLEGLSPHVLRDPAWVPVAVAPEKDRVRFRRFVRPFYIAHAGTHPSPWDAELPLSEIESAAATLHDPAKVIYVYHHGYVGSTLLFRLLDCPGVCLAYDEPHVHLEHYADRHIRALCYRTFFAAETPLIKTLPSEIGAAAQHFADHSEARGLFFYSAPEDYIAATLAHAYRRAYVIKMARTLEGVECSDAGEAAVRCWNWITAKALAVAAVHPLKAIDAEVFFSDPERHLTAMWAWLGFPPRDDWSETLARISSSHSKNRRPFASGDRRAQQRAHRAQAASWLDAHRPDLEGMRTTLTALARFNL